MMNDESSLSLTKADIAEMKDLDRRLTEAMSRKDLDAVMECFWNDPDLVIMLNGTVYRGPDETRAAIKALFDQNESISLKVNEITHVPSGDAVIGVGTATYDLKPLGGQRKLLVERWSDLRRKIDGHWVYVLDHTTHLPD
jgi:ketosteroid isomerase-like protein